MLLALQREIKPSLLSNLRHTHKAIQQLESAQLFDGVARNAK